MVTSMDLDEKKPSWWQGRSEMERGLIALTGVVVSLCIVLMIALSITTYQPQEPEICLQEGCVLAASELLSSMDPSAKPCDDFYQFACGKFKTKPIPEEKSGLSPFTTLGEKIEEQLKAIISEPVSVNDTKPLQSGKNLYKLCMNKTQIERMGAEPLLNLFKSLGGWPLLEGDDWPMENWTWKDAIYDFRKKGLGIDYFMQFDVGTDSKNSSYRIIEIDQAPLADHREYLVQGLESERIQAYYDFTVDIAVMLGADRKRAEKELNETLDFEVALAKITLPKEERRDGEKLYNKMTIAQMQREFPSIPWLEYVTNIMALPIAIDENEPVVLVVPGFIKQLEKLLQDTQKRVLANFLFVRVAGQMTEYLPEVFRDRSLKYSAAITGTTKREPRWKECSAYAIKSVFLAVSSKYVKKHFEETTKQGAEELVESIKNQMLKTLQTVDWMDENTRKNAIEKLKAMVSHIAYPSELVDDNKLNEFYKKLEINNNGNYLEAISNSTRFGHDYEFGLLRQKLNKTEWVNHGVAMFLSPSYKPKENSIELPAGILQGAFFSDKRPNYMNYGAIGLFIGHEITHGFDDQGRQFDKEGNLFDWWDEKSKNQYLEKAKCIIDQYSKYNHPQVNMNLNGINTQGENIADNGGLKQAYKAYTEWAASSDEEPRLPGFAQYTPNQMFWISAASTWCSVYRNKTLSILINTDEHAPEEFRVKGPFSNLEDFSKDFQCPPGSPMNPKEKCQVW